ncbi:MAG: 2Fe-2S iron-sulfur cluster-binding protein [Thalassotalea sp.]|nr:2Fe-2S iron-sulfur cluster-binding protein [Thalassotalea sp.]
MTLIKKIHKWASIIVGLQVLIWLSSGFYFNVMDHKKAKGTQYRVTNTYKMILESSKLIEPKQALESNRLLEKSEFSKSSNSVVSISLSHLFGQPVYLLTHEKGLYRHFKNSYSMADAYTGKQITIDAELAEKLASATYSGPGKVKSVTLLEKSVDDFPKEKNSAWQINYADELNTSVYIEAGSGRLIGHSNDDKRFADILFMLHFMDYASEGNFNSIQIILFAFITLWLTLTGFIWTIKLGFEGQYQLTLFSNKRIVQLLDKDHQPIGSVSLNDKTNLLDGLTKNQIYIPSVCGGGGTCGSCRILLSPQAKITDAEYEKLSKFQLEKGYRLSCQQFLADIESITILN